MEQEAPVDPFWWALHVPEKTGMGKTLALVLHSMFHSASGFGNFIDNMPHGDTQHPSKGFACFKCMLKAMHLATYVAKNGDQMIELFVEICDRWSVDVNIESELVWYLLTGFETWAKEHGESDCESNFYRLFRFDTHVKWGCYHCKEHFSSSSSQYLFEVGGRTLHLYLTQLTTEIWRACSKCKVETGYDRVSLGRLPLALVFANARSPLVNLKIEEAEYVLSIVIPNVLKLEAFVLSQEGGWLQISLKGAPQISNLRPAQVDFLAGVMDYTFYSKI
ncbi:uncharacterized protein LOC124678294 [Lolium rigidum]|uniref:uncharacterized protein LOC124678294 n=1 Tax=Lolium rigidum TaxID=89674 RepID=UPI001F5CE0AC|nr:uncharacterized protein LOC124678294 [Lolium rigidum]